MQPRQAAKMGGFIAKKSLGKWMPNEREKPTLALASRRPAPNTSALCASVLVFESRRRPEDDDDGSWAPLDWRRRKKAVFRRESIIDP